jgi:hypothetical protein
MHHEGRKTTMKHVVAAVLTLALLQGCALFSTPPSKPIVEDKIGVEDAKSSDKRIGTLATVAQRRLMVVKFSDGRFCAEPPPDAADNVSANLSAALAGGVHSPAGPSVNASAQLAGALASIAKQIFYRSQGLQLYRDGMFSLCSAYLNGVMSPSEFKDKQLVLLNIVKDLIALEIPHMDKMKTDSSIAATPTNPTALTVPQPPGK